MDVGQVSFTVEANNLNTVLQQALQLQTVLNNIDGKTFGKWNAQAAKIQAANDKHAYMAAKIQTEQAKKELTDTRKQTLINNIERKKQRGAEKQRLTDERNYNRAVQRSLRNHKALIKQTEREAAARQKQTQAMLNAPKEYQKQWEHNLVNLGARMQTLGATVERMTTPFANVLTGFGRMAGYMLYSKVFQSIQGMFSRYDTMKTYEKVLNNIGLDATKKFVVGTGKADTAIKNLEQSVLGLPTGLDEIVASMKVYAGITGDVEKATKVAIAANNAFIAGGMDETRTRMAERQLQNILSNGELTAMQWNSLQKNMPMAFNAVARELGYAQKDAGKLLADLKEGTVEANDFIDAFIKVGTEGKIHDAAQVMKQTWSSVSQNITNAFNRMGEGILSALDEVFKKTDGRTFLQHILGVDSKGKDVGDGIKHMIDDLSKSAQQWIKANPQKITKFFESLKKIDIKAIAGAYAQFGGILLKLYTGMARLFGGGNGFLLKMALFANIGSKILRIAGGLTKGLAGPLSKLFKLFTYGAAGKAGGGLVGMFTRVGAAGKAAGTAVASWQGVASMGISVAAIPAIAWSLKEVALAMQEFGKVKLSWGLVGKMQVAAALVGEFTLLTTALGSLLASSPVGWISTAAATVGTTEVAAIAKTMKWIGEGLNAIANADLPSSSKIYHVMETIADVENYFKARNPFEALGVIFDSWAKSAEFQSIAKIGGAFKAVSDIVSYELPKGWSKKATKRLTAMQEVISSFETTFAEIGAKIEGEKGKPSRNGWTTSTQTLGAKIETFANGVENIRGVMDNMVAIIQNATEINKQIDKAVSKMPPSATRGEKNTALFSQVTDSIKQISDGLYQFLGAKGFDGKTVVENLQEVCSAFSQIHMGNIKNQINYIPEMIQGIVNINNQLAASTRGLINSNGTTHLSGVSDKLKPIFEDISKLSDIIPTNLGGLKKLKSINSALKKVHTTFDKLKELSNLDTNGINTTGIETLATRIKDALSSLEEIGEKEIKIELKADITGGDQVVKDVKSEIKDVKKQINALDSTVTKKIYAHLQSGGVSGGFGIVEAVRNRIAEIKRRIANLNGTVNKTVTTNVGGGGGGGDDWQHGGRVYRAGGGSLRRGTDTIPTMLTSGEWVVNRHAASAIGDDILNKLNHLDIRSALNSLSLKAGQIQSRTINNNSTKNANVTVNNYHSDGIGYGRASRVVRGL